MTLISFNFQLYPEGIHVLGIHQKNGIYQNPLTSSNLALTMLSAPSDSKPCTMTMNYVQLLLRHRVWELQETDVREQRKNDNRLISTTHEAVCVRRRQRIKYGAHEQVGYMFVGTFCVIGSFLVNTSTVLDTITSVVLYYSRLNRFQTDVKLANGQCSVYSTVLQRGLEVWKYHSGIGDK